MGKRPTPATMISLLALFIAMGGTATALKGKNTVFSDDIKNGQVKTQDLARNAVGGKQIKAGALRSRHFAPGSIGGDLLAPNAVTQDKVAPGAIGPLEIADGAVGPQHLDPATPAASVTHSADQTIEVGEPTKLSFDTEVFDTANLHSASPASCLTAPTKGIYDITAGITWAARNNGYRQVVLRKNDSTNLAQAIVDGVAEAGEQTTQNVSTTVPLAAGDCVTVEVLQVSTVEQGGAPIPTPLAVKSETGANGNSPSFTMAYALPGS